MPLPVLTREQFLERRSVFDWEAYVDERVKVRRIIARVRRRGDTALRDYTRRFDGVEIEDFRVSTAEMEGARETVEEEVLESLHGAARNIEAFHRHQVGASWWAEAPGKIYGQRWRPLRSAGIYIPGGTAPYPSTVLMAVIPARLAGVQNIYLCTPPNSAGKVPDLILAAAAVAGATSIFKVGGAQAVAALAYGTESIPAVQKIVGPGNIYVALAKKEVYGKVGVDFLAGPSEVVVVADVVANAAYIAADLLSQAEHDPLARPILLTTSPAMAELVRHELEYKLAVLPRREIAERSLKEQGGVVVLRTMDEVIDLVNLIAPEHLELHLDDPWAHLDRFENAGAIFIGAHTPEPVGDYWVGSNHILPTGGGARFASPLGIYDFMKWTNLIYYSPEALQADGPEIERLARLEGFEAHARAVAARRGEHDGTQGDD